MGVKSSRIFREKYLSDYTFCEFVFIQNTELALIISQMKLKLVAMSAKNAF